MRNMTLVVETIVLVMACVDCSGGNTGSNAGPETTNSCIMSSPCTCDDGSPGQKVCDSGTGVFIQCECRHSGLPRGGLSTVSVPGGSAPIMAMGSSGFNAPAMVGGSNGGTPTTAGVAAGAGGMSAAGASGAAAGSGGAAGAAGAAGTMAGSGAAAGAKAAGSAGSAGR